MTDSIFDADELAADAVIAQPDPDTQPDPQTDGPVRDEQGRFAPKADEPAVEPQTDDERAKQVPHAALHAERERAKEWKAKAEAAQATLDAIQQMRAQAAARKPQEPTPPPVTEDPAAEMQHLRQRLAELGGNVHQIQQRDEMSRIDQAETQHIASLMRQSEDEFRASTPDYDEAINHVVQARAQELMIYGLSPMEVEQTIRAEVADIARAAVRQGRSPAEVAYQLAKLRGYQGQAQQQPAQQQSAAARTVAAVGAAQAKSRSLGQASGGGSTKEINAQTIAAMNIEEFDALYNTPEGRKLIDAL